MRFEERHSPWKRREEALRVLAKFPSRVPIIVQVSTGSQKSLGRLLRKKKYLVPLDLKMGQFLGVLRANMQLKPHAALFALVKGNKIPPIGDLIISVYHKFKSEDHFLYIDLCSENTFGYVCSF